MSSTLNVPAAALFENEDFDDGAIIFPDTPLPQKMEFAGKRAAILGIGALSSTYVVILSSLGFAINVWGDPAHRTQYNAMKAQGSVATGTSVKGSFRVTFCDELEDALRGATMVFATTPTYALHRLFIDMKALYDGPLRSDVATFTHLFLVPSCMEAPGARLVFGADYPKRIYEVSSATITAKWDAPAAVTHIKKMKRSLEVASLGGLQQNEIDFIKKFFVNDNVTEQSMLEIFMNSPGSRIHQMGIVAGLDTIKSRHADPSARYYRDVIASPAVGTLINNFEDDLFRIATKWGITPKPIVQWFNDTYPPPEGIPPWQTVAEWAQWNGPQNAQSMMPNPAGLSTHRFLVEDGRHSCRLEKLAQLANMAPSEYRFVTYVVDQLCQIAKKNIREDAGLADIGLDRCVTMDDFRKLLN